MTPETFSASHNLHHLLTELFHICLMSMYLHIECSYLRLRTDATHVLSDYQQDLIRAFYE